jgi:hypothetical protein
MTSGIDKAISDIAGLSDMPTPVVSQKVGGRRGRRSMKRRSRGKRSMKRSRKQRQRRRGGALGYAPISAPGMLLDGNAYSQAGLNPEYRGSAVEYNVAKARDSV